MQKKKMVIFDFDGVLVDSFWLTHQTSKKAYPGITEEMHRDAFEGNIYEWEKTIVHLENKKIDYFAEYEKEVHLVKFFKVEDVVRELAKEYLLSIVSSSPTYIIKDFLVREDLLRHFGDILGADVHESKHEKINMLFERHKLEPRDCVMITDTVGDVREARKAGVDSIGVSWGFHEPHRFEKVKTFRIIHEPRDVESAIKDFFSR